MGFGARARRSCARTSWKQSKCNFEGGRAISVCAKEAAVGPRIIRGGGLASMANGHLFAKAGRQLILFYNISCRLCYYYTFFIVYF